MEPREADNEVGRRVREAMTVEMLEAGTAGNLIVAAEIMELAPSTMYAGKVIGGCSRGVGSTNGTIGWEEIKSKRRRMQATVDTGGRGMFAEPLLHDTKKRLSGPGI